MTGIITNTECSTTSTVMVLNETFHVSIFFPVNTELFSNLHKQTSIPACCDKKVIQFLLKKKK